MKVKIEAILKITYDSKNISPKGLVSLVDEGIRHAIDRGLLGEDIGEIEVDDWSLLVVQTGGVPKVKN